MREMRERLLEEKDTAIDRIKEKCDEKL